LITLADLLFCTCDILQPYVCGKMYL